MNNFYKKWEEVKNMTIESFQRRRPKKLYGCRMPENGIAIVTPIRDFFQEHGTKGGSDIKDSWLCVFRDFSARYERPNKDIASFFELIDQFHFLIENDGPPRLIAGDLFTHAIDDENHLFKQDSIIPICYQEVGVWPNEINFVRRGPPVLDARLAFKCLSMGKDLGAQSEKYDNIIHHVGYVNNAERDRVPSSRAKIKFHIRTPVDESFIDLLTGEFRWKIIEEQQWRVDAAKEKLYLDPELFKEFSI